MKVLWLLVIFALSVSALPIEDAHDDGAHINGETGWYVPQWDGTLEWMTLEEGDALLEELEKEDDIEGRLSTAPVTYYLYTQANPTKGQKITDSVKSISGSNFNAANPTRFVIHGWTQSYTAPMNKEIRDAWLTHGDVNVIIVDWARARSIDYASSVVAVSKTGKKVGKMINYLHNSHGMSLNTLHVIGHSLGAHVAGYAGKTISGGQAHTIVGLDPALPLFHYSKPKKRLNSEDAFYVESIQTNGGGLGFLKPIGRGAFYPNGGESQPGCSLDLTGACSHGRSCTYYAEAVESDNFASIKCKVYKDAVKNSCGSTYSSVRMGSESNAYVVDGSHYVPVNSKSPHGFIV